MATLADTPKGKASSEAQEGTVRIGKIPPQEQVTVRDTGWSDAQKAAMQQYGYDNLDIVRAWYS